MAQQRRADDVSMQILTEKFDKFATESAVWREQLGREVKSNSAQIKCLADHFYKYKPQLEEGLTRRKWWQRFWEERRQELITYSVRGGAIALCGLVIYALSNKFVTWIRNALNGVA
jgi:hypothetical protein